MSKVLARLASLLAVVWLAAGPLRADQGPVYAAVELKPIEWPQDTLRIVDTAGGETVYTIDALEDLPTYAIDTTTPWEPEPRHFEGVMLADLLQRHGLGGRGIEVLAANDFVATIDADVLAGGTFMIATRIDGRPLSRRDRGPLLFVVPSTAVGTTVAEHHLVWMAAEIRPLG